MMKKMTFTLFLTFCSSTVNNALAYDFINLGMGQEVDINNQSAVVLSDTSEIIEYNLKSGISTTIDSGASIKYNIDSNDLGDIIWVKEHVPPNWFNTKISIMRYAAEDGITSELNFVVAPLARQPKPKLNDQGDAVWDVLGESPFMPGAITYTIVFAYNALTNTTSTISANSDTGLLLTELMPDINDHGSVAWLAHYSASGYSDSRVYFKEPGSAVSIEVEKQLQPLIRPKLNNNNELIWLETSPSSTLGAYDCTLIKSNVERTTTDTVTTFVGCLSPEIAILENGNVVYSESGASSNYLTYYEAQSKTTTPIASNIEAFAYNDAGDIVWTSMGDTNPGVFLRRNDTGEIVTLTTTPSAEVAINGNGDIVFIENSGTVVLAQHTPEPLELIVNQLEFDKIDRKLEANIDYQSANTLVSPNTRIKIMINNEIIVDKPVSSMITEHPGEYSYNSAKLEFELNTDSSRIELNKLDFNSDSVVNKNDIEVYVKMGDAEGVAHYATP